MKKTLALMTAMLFALVATASDYFLQGSFNNWKVGDQQYKFTSKSDGSYSLEYGKAFSGEFLINDGSVTVAGSNSATLIPGMPYAYTTSSTHIALYCSVKSAVFTINPSRGTVIVEPIGVQNIPNGYYDAIMGLTNGNLKTAVSNSCVYVLTSTKDKTYTNLSTTFKKTDVYPGTDYWWDMYSDQLTDINLTFGTAESQGGGGMNREHSFPKSWWGGTSVETPAYCDLNHLFPSKGTPNNYKSNHPMGIVAKASYDNGVVKIGTPAAGYGGGSKTVFEPNDEYKGDFARAYFYMVTRYQDLTWEENGLYMLDNNLYPTLQPWAVNMLLEWSRNDPVSNKEINRNEVVYSIQKNRNPFIDYPELAEYIWGVRVGVPFTPGPVFDIVSVESITISASSATMGQGETLQLTATVAPDNATNKAVVWSSNNSSVATVSAGGLVTAVAPGNATITVYADDDMSVRATCKVTVTASQVDPQPADILIEHWNNSALWGNGVLPTKSEDASQTVSCTSSETGVSYTMFGVYRPTGGYLMLYSSKADAYVEFTLPFDCEQIKLQTSGSCSTNAQSMVNILADNNAIVNNLAVNERNTEYIVDIPEGKQAKGTVYRIARSNNKANQQFVTFTFVKAQNTIVVTPGDVDGDGTVSVADVVAICNHILGTPTEGFDATAADVNGDNEITAADIVLIVNIILSASGN